MRFSTREIKELCIAGIAISVAFGFLFIGGLAGIKEITTNGAVLIFSLAFLTGGLGFLLHELMHKFVAQRYRLNAEFFTYYPALWLAVGCSLFGFIIAAPGAVHISGSMRKEEYGKTALAGPITNIVLAVAFLLGLFINEGSMLFSLGFKINALLALFNMIPFHPFDGGKVIVWSKQAYYTTTVIALLLFIASFVL